jgi:hypothetical protein
MVGASVDCAIATAQFRPAAKPAGHAASWSAWPTSRQRQRCSHFSEQRNRTSKRRIWSSGPQTAGAAVRPPRIPASRPNSQ